MIKYNPKALDIEKIRNTDKRVTLGFKCSPLLKVEMAEKAAAGNMTLSEYVEGLVINMPSENLSLRKKIENIESRLSYYENNNILVSMLEREFEKVYEIYNPDGNMIKVKILGVKDIFDVMVNSFKSK
jgi:hypothetical protein